MGPPAAPGAAAAAPVLGVAMCLCPWSVPRRVRELLQTRVVSNKGRGRKPGSFCSATGDEGVEGEGPPPVGDGPWWARLNGDCRGGLGTSSTHAISWIVSSRATTGSSMTVIVVSRVCSSIGGFKVGQSQRSPHLQPLEKEEEAFGILVAIRRQRGAVTLLPPGLGRAVGEAGWLSCWLRAVGTGLWTVGRGFVGLNVQVIRLVL